MKKIYDKIIEMQIRAEKKKQEEKVVAKRLNKLRFSEKSIKSNINFCI